MPRIRGRAPAAPSAATPPAREARDPLLTDYLDAEELALPAAERDRLAYGRWKRAYHRWSDEQSAAGRIVGMDGDHDLWDWDRAAQVGHVRPR